MQIKNNVGMSSVNTRRREKLVKCEASIKASTKKQGSASKVPAQFLVGGKNPKRLRNRAMTDNTLLRSIYEHATRRVPSTAYVVLVVLMHMRHKRSPIYGTAVSPSLQGYLGPADKINKYERPRSHRYGVLCDYTA